MFADPIVTQEAIASSWQPIETAFARISARQQTHLSVPFDVRITALNVEPGTKVKTGDELARFDAPMVRLHLAAWLLARQEQALTHKRLRLLRKNEKEHTITRRALILGEQSVALADSKASLAWETLAANLDILHIKISKTDLAKQIKKQGLQTIAKTLSRLQAPFDGVVTARRTSLGEQVHAGAPILELETLDSIYLDVGVTEALLPVWQKGKAIWPGHSDKVQLKRIDGIPRYDHATGLWLIRFEAKNPDYLLREGNWVKLEHLGAPIPIVWLPATAVVARNGKTWAIVAKDSTYKAVKIEVGSLAADGRIPVTKGIQPGTIVVTKGAYELLYRDLKDLIKFVD